jgi:hypothetical protein
MRAYFVLPNGAHFLQLSMGGSPPVYRQPTSHPDIRAQLPTLNPAATHVEFVRTDLYVTLLVRRDRGATRDDIVGLRLWVYARAVRHVGPLVDNVWMDVPLEAAQPA